ncbi:MAG: type II toxin-antitoxin system HicB family antitoxin [Bacteroidota bacterium]
MKNAELTIIVQKDLESGWFVGQIEEFPAAISQGKTIDELEENLKAALKLLLEVQKEDLRKDYASKKITKRKLQFA